MQKGEELGIIPIKFENHQSNKDLDKCIYSVNDLLFKYRFSYINNTLKNIILRGIEDNCTEAKKLSLTAVIDKRRQEFITKCRDIYKALRDYISDESKDDIQKMVNYRVAVYIKNKAAFLANSDECYRLLKESNDFQRVYSMTNLDLWAFNSMNKELLNAIAKNFQINIE